MNTLSYPLEKEESSLSYQQKVVLAALALTDDYRSEKGYEFYSCNDGVILTPWHFISGRGKTYSQSLTVNKTKIHGRDETLISELEKKVKDIFESA